MVAWCKSLQSEAMLRDRYRQEFPKEPRRKNTPIGRVWLRPPSPPSSGDFTLVYATGGYAYGKVETNVSTSAGNFSADSTRSGWTAGAGIETPFTFLGLFGPNWTSKTEYLYVDLGNASTSVTAPLVATNSGHLQEHIFRTGLNYHFNTPVVAKY